MKKIIVVSITVAILLILATLGLLLWSDNIVKGKNNQTRLDNKLTISVTPTVQQMNGSLTIPSSDQIISLVNWSKYPLISYYYVSEAVIAEPNSIINYTFTDVHLKVGIKSADDVLEVYNELSSIVKAERALIGQDSSIEVFGYIEDGRIFLAGMLPYSTEIYRRDYVHPIHNLTFSDIDMSEVD